MQEVVAEAAEDHVVGVCRVEQRVVAAEPVRAQVERRDVERLVEPPGRVERRGLRAARRRDVGLGRRRDAIERLGGPVAAREDAAVVAEDAVLAGAAGDPVVAPAADDVVVVAVAEQPVVAAAGVDPVVAALAVDLVVAAVRRIVGDAGRLVGERRGRARDAVAVGPEVRAARHVVQQRDAAHDELLVVGAVVVVAERQQGAGGRHEPVDVAVVADDRVRVAAVRRGGGGVRPRGLRAGAAEEVVAGVRPLRRAGRA